MSCGRYFVMECRIRARVRKNYHPEVKEQEQKFIAGGFSHLAGIKFKLKISHWY
jgi:hypothetical protein